MLTSKYRKSKTANRLNAEHAAIQLRIRPSIPNNAGLLQTRCPVNVPFLCRVIWRVGQNQRHRMSRSFRNSGSESPLAIRAFATAKTSSGSMADLILLKSCSLELMFLDSRLRPAFLNRSKNFCRKISIGLLSSRRSATINRPLPRSSTPNCHWPPGWDIAGERARPGGRFRRRAKNRFLM